MPDPEQPPPSSESLVRVFAAPDVAAGLAARGLLESQGIPVFTKGEGGGGPYPAGPLYLWVPETFAEEATALLAAAERGDLAAELDEHANGEGGWPD